MSVELSLDSTLTVAGDSHPWPRRLTSYRAACELGRYSARVTLEVLFRTRRREECWRLEEGVASRSKKPSEGSRSRVRRTRGAMGIPSISA
jgi:hypothetical protein